MKTIHSVALFLVLLSLQSIAQKPLSIKKLSVFKNGTALFVKEGSKNLTNAELKLPIPENALNGTYWLGVNKENSIKSIVFKNDTIKVKKETLSFYDILFANKGKIVTIHASPKYGLDKTYIGTILEYNRSSDLLKMQADKKIISINAKDIYDLSFDNDPIKMYEDDSIARMMVVKFEKESMNTGLQEYYMQTGINWMPSYFLKLKDDKNARLELKATLENSAEDLIETETELVVGAPQMYYGSELDPMTYNYMSNNNLANQDPTTMKLAYMNSNVMQTLSGNGTYEEVNYDGFANSFSTEGEKNNDMYIYKLGKITLLKNTKGNFPIQAGALEYKDKYEAEINDFTNFYSSRYCDESDKNVEAFHSIEIKNLGSTPFTTAPIFVVNDKDQFLAQDQMKYTPVGSNASIQLSKAIDIVIKNNEEESNRAEAVKKVGKQVYNKVVIKGTVTINNFQNKEVNLTIKKNLSGTVNQSSDAGTVIKRTSYNYLNPSSTVKWDLKLAPNEKRVLNYEYEVFYMP